MVELNCGTCVHWHRSPPDPNNLKDVRGSCRESPPSVTVYPNGSNIAAYPQLPQEFPACSRHQPMVETE